MGHVLDVIGKAEGVLGVSALSTLIMPSGTFFLCDTQVSEKPTVEELAEMIRLSAEAVSRLGEVPKIALLSHSNFGAAPTESAVRMRRAVELVTQQAPDLEIDGEMQADLALDEDLRQRIFPNLAQGRNPQAECRSQRR